MYWFWIFMWYSFIGFIIEKLFAAACDAEHRVRKCFLLLPLCPVYGLAMTALLLIGAERIDNIWALMVIGAAVTTAARTTIRSAASPASSCASRIAACSAVSWLSRAPPGSDQVPPW